jgi:hypothetical protein
MHWDVTNVRTLPDFVLAVELKDGRAGIFDVKPFLQHASLARLRDPAYFRQVGIQWGALTWPEQEDIAPDTLEAHLQPLAITAPA